MSRIRSIKPDAFESLTLARVPVAARWLFAGIWTAADDEGRISDSPALIRSKVFPVDDLPLAEVEGWLAALVDVGSLCRYAGPDGEPLLHVVSWKRHQVINKPSPSRLAECPTHRGTPRTMRLTLARPPMPVAAPDESEPQRRCPDHLDVRSAPRCGACKEARIAHEQWVKENREQKAKEAELAASTLCGSATCTCDHNEPCDHGWITVESRLPNGAPVEAQAKCPVCFPGSVSSTSSERSVRFQDARELGAEYADARAAAAGDR